MIGNGKGPAGFIPTHEYIDFRGNVIVEGDTIVYAALSGRSCQLVEAVVHGIVVKSRQVEKREWHWVWDMVKYDRMHDDPNRHTVTDREWTDTVYDHKLQLLPTGRSGRWEQHSNTHWNSALCTFVPTDVKPVWIMAENACKPV